MMEPTTLDGRVRKRGKLFREKLKRVSTKFLKKPIKIRGAGRTDAGVHALAQVASFKADLKISLSVLKKSLKFSSA